uniref:PAS domain-containing protein n=1 Tax=Muriicola sp. TaxID=2020856 RepID=UPI00356B5DE3
MRYLKASILLLFLCVFSQVSAQFTIPEKPELQTSVYDYVSLLSQSDRKALEEKLTGKKNNFDLEMRLKTRRGDWHWVKVRGRIVERDSSEQPLRMSGTVTDIHKRKQA